MHPCRFALSAPGCARRPSGYAPASRDRIWPRNPVRSAPWPGVRSTPVRPTTAARRAPWGRPFRPPPVQVPPGDPSRPPWPRGRRRPAGQLRDCGLHGPRPRECARRCRRTSHRTCARSAASPQGVHSLGPPARGLMIEFPFFWLIDSGLFGLGVRFTDALRPTAAPKRARPTAPRACRRHRPGPCPAGRRRPSRQPGPRQSGSRRQR